METDNTGNGKDNTVEDLLKMYQQKAEELGGIQQATQTYQTWPNPQPCPSCGHCPTCGRGGHYAQPYYPSYPWITWTNYTGGYVPTTTTGADSNLIK